jgi:hypothetical protein
MTKFLSFLWLNKIPLCINTIFLIHSSVVRHLGYFHCLAIVNSTAINIGYYPIYASPTPWPANTVFFKSNKMCRFLQDNVLERALFSSHLFFFFLEQGHHLNENRSRILRRSYAGSLQPQGDKDRAGCSFYSTLVTSRVLKQSEVLCLLESMSKALIKSTFSFGNIL